MELLVVIVIIGILSAIAIAAFLNQRKKANDAAVESDMRMVVNTIETMLVDHPNAQSLTVTSEKPIFEEGGGIDYEGFFRHNSEYTIEIYDVPNPHKVSDGKHPDSISQEKITLSEGVYIDIPDPLNTKGYSLQESKGYFLAGSHWNGDKYKYDPAGIEEEMLRYMEEEGLSYREAEEKAIGNVTLNKLVYNSGTGVFKAMTQKELSSL